MGELEEQGDEMCILRFYLHVSIMTTQRQNPMRAEACKVVQTIACLQNLSIPVFYLCIASGMQETRTLTFRDHIYD